MKIIAKMFCVLSTSLLLFQSRSLGWEGPSSSIGGGLMSPGRPSNFIDGIFSFTPAGVATQNGRLRGNLLVSETESDSYQINFKSELIQFSSPVLLGGTSINSPIRLWTLDLGGTYKRKINSSEDWGLLLSGGSDSDIPFNSLAEVDLNVTATYRWQKDPLHSWIFLLNYSKTRSFAPGIPLPGAGYLVIDPENHTQIFYGLPLLVGWQPEKQWRLSASYLLLTTVNVEVARTNLAGIKTYLSAQWNSQSWLRANRADTSNHIIFDQKKIIIGASSSIGETLFLNIYGGFAFDQRITEAYSITSQNINFNDLPASPIAQAEAAYKF